jgi:hypothetical protein
MPSLPRNPPIRPRWVRDSTSLSSVQSLYVVELKLSLRTRLARQVHARRMPIRREVYCQSSPSALLTPSNNERHTGSEDEIVYREASETIRGTVA